MFHSFSRVFKGFTSFLFLFFPSFFFSVFHSFFFWVFPRLRWVMFPGGCRSPPPPRQNFATRDNLKRNMLESVALNTFLFEFFFVFRVFWGVFGGFRWFCFFFFGGGVGGSFQILSRTRQNDMKTTLIDTKPTLNYIKPTLKCTQTSLNDTRISQNSLP